LAAFSLPDAVAERLPDKTVDPVVESVTEE